MAEEGLFDYHLYTLERPTTIRDNQTKQVALLQAADVPVVKEYELKGQEYYYRSKYREPQEKLKVGVYLSLDNTKANNLGLPLPKGVVRVYKQDSGDRVQFIGADRIDIHLDRGRLVDMLRGDQRRRRVTQSEPGPTADTIVLSVPARLKRAGIGKRMVIEGAHAGAPDATLIKLVVKAFALRHL